jgi:tripartite-type tricarboxylate transporter receptor subunit TctC
MQKFFASLFTSLSTGLAISIAILFGSSGTALAQTPDRRLAQAQPQPPDASWPSRNIKLIVPFQPGSSSDAVGRVVGQKLGERLGQSIIIENRVGASGNLGTEGIARAEPDGYTIGLANTSTHAVAPSLSATLRYDPIKDFTMISMLGDSPFAIIVFPGMSAKSLKDLLATAREKPKTLNYASAGPDSMSHLAGALLEKTANVELVHVPYRGTGQSIMDLISGRIEIVFATLPPSLQLIQEGKVRALAVTGARRNETMPDIPTVAEGGYPDFNATLWQAFVAPAGLPPAIAKRLTEATIASVKDETTRKLLVAQGVEPEPSTPEQLGKRIADDIEKWRIVIRGASIAMPKQ